MMTHDPEVAAFDTSTRWPDANAPVLSILIPTFDHDVVPLCRELLADMALVAFGQVELLVLIDGNQLLANQQALLPVADQLGQPAALAMAAVNLGRGQARNCLARLARGQFLQFLDADSLPDAPGFVQRILVTLQAEAFDPALVLCGGRTGRRQPPAPADAKLFELQSRKREWIAAALRNIDPAGNFLSANFAVARNLFHAHPFDPTFHGWGWEDTEWAARISAHARVVHIENTVSHMEFHRDATWVSRLERSAVNYARLYHLHPTVVRRHRIFPLIVALRRLQNGRLPTEGLNARLAGALRWLALRRSLPPALRLTSLKLLQALVYGKVIDQPSAFAIDVK